MRSPSKKGVVIAILATVMLIADTSARFDKKDSGVTRKNLRVIPRTISEERLIASMR